MYGAGATTYGYPQQNNQGQNWLDQSRQPAQQQPAQQPASAAQQYNPQVAQPQQQQPWQRFDWNSINGLVDQQRRQLLQPQNPAQSLQNVPIQPPRAIVGISEMIGQNNTNGPAPQFVGNSITDGLNTPQSQVRGPDSWSGKSITDGLNTPQPQVGPPPPQMSDPLRPPGWQQSQAGRLSIAPPYSPPNPQPQWQAPAGQQPSFADWYQQNYRSQGGMGAGDFIGDNARLVDPRLGGDANLLYTQNMRSADMDQQRNQIDEARRRYNATFNPAAAQQERIRTMMAARRG